MRIHRIKLCNYRGVSQSEVTFPVQGVTIIEGDNEIGKTSLSEAIDLLLGERDDSSKQRVKAVKPVHKDVGAEAEIELSTGPYRFIYRKRWHKQRETVLEILEPRRSQFTGREAHDKVRAILDETLDETLWDAFRLKQGAKLEQAAFAGGSLGRALDKAAGGDTTGDREDDLWERITAERDRYWTATGQVKSDRTALAARVADATARVATLETTLQSLEDDAAAVDRLRDEAKVLLEQENAHKESEDALGGAVRGDPEPPQRRRPIGGAARHCVGPARSHARREHRPGRAEAAGGRYGRGSCRHRVKGRRCLARPPRSPRPADHGAAEVRRRQSRNSQGRGRPAACCR